MAQQLYLKSLLEARRAVAAALLLFILAGCSTLTNLFPGSALEFVEPTHGTTVYVGEQVPVTVSAAPSVRSVHLEVDGSRVTTLGATGDGSFAGTFTPQRTGLLRVTAVAVDDGANQKTTFVDLMAREIQRFSIVVIPDTQGMIEDPNDTMVNQMMDWVVSQKDELNIEFVTQLGDIVQDGSQLDEWQRADGAFDRLDGVVPYSFALGNHDYAETFNMGSSTENYENYFGSARFSGYAWYGGTGPGGTNHYQIFEAGSRRFLHLSLEFEVPGSVGDPSTPLGWARDIIESNPGLPTIISTHSYLWDQPGDEGRFPASARMGYIEDSSGNKTYPGTSGQGIFEALVEPYPQVFMVLNGHWHLGEDGEDGEYHQVSINSAGLPVYEMLSDYQDYPAGGQGWLRIIEFVPEGGAGNEDRINVRTYSPVLDRYQTDANSQFQFDLSFEERWARD